jgi:hypothetical protein
MRQIDSDLLSFLFKMIEAKIKDYHQLAKIGVGPDARLIARLISEEVTALLGYAEALLKSRGPNGFSPQVYNNLFPQIKFYVGLEHLRSRAGYLVDDNNIHNITHRRAEQQVKDLESLETEESKLITFKAHSASERQIEHDSYEVAYLVIKSAVALIENPDVEIEAKTAFGHGLDRMKGQAASGGRYHRLDVHEAIYTFYTNCHTFLRDSRLKKRTHDLQSREAVIKKEADIKSLAMLRALQASPIRAAKSSAYCSSALFFKVATAVVVASVGATFLARKTLGNS